MNTTACTTRTIAGAGVTSSTTISKKCFEKSTTKNVSSSKTQLPTDQFVLGTDKRESNQHKNSSKKAAPHHGHHLARNLLRCLLLDLPSMLVFASYLGMLLLEHVHDSYLLPIKLQMEWTPLRRDAETTAYHYSCTPDDISATSAAELVIDEDMDIRKDALPLMQRHGATIFPKLLSNTTAHALREFILHENKRLSKKDELFWVIEGKHRYSFGIQVDQDATVTMALQELLGGHSSPSARLVEMLEQMMGRNPAVIEFTAITSTYGAVLQNHHQDVVPQGSAAKYGRSFVPSYSLFIPLQDTSEEMGATEICPGTQICANEHAVEALCDEHSVLASSASDDEVWPAGWGALVNQQTTHRGTAHVDPTLGQERVVFILTFAPRPQYSLPGVIESRMIGQRGSYSLHWNQWGHTLQDFANPTTQMRQPWRTLRSFGIYLPTTTSDWGWDVVTVALMRMANGDNGYTWDTLEEFVMEQTGVLAFLPRWLQGTFHEEYGEEDDDAYEELDIPLDGGWHEFLVTTGHKVKDALKIANQIVLGIFGIGLGIAAIGSAVRNKRMGAGVATLGRGVGRLLFTHGSLLIMAWLLLQRVDNSLWARHIRNGKLFRPLNITAEVSSSSSLSEDEDAGENSFVPFTLPNRHDVLVDSHYQSRYLSSYAHILEYNQPGNVVWKQLVAEHSQGFAQLPSRTLQSDYCDFLIGDLMYAQHAARFLHQPEAGRWSEMLLEDSKEYCLSQLMMDHDRLTKLLLREIAFLRTETKVGAWRDKAIHKSHIPAYLDFWTNAILDLQRNPNHEAESVLPKTTEGSQGAVALSIRRPLVTPTTVTPVADWKTASSIPFSPVTVTEPHNGAWLSSGDFVEAKYQIIYDGEYLPSHRRLHTAQSLCITS